MNKVSFNFHRESGHYVNVNVLRVTTKVNEKFVSHVWVQNGYIEYSGTDVFVRNSDGTLVTILPITDCVGLDGKKVV